MVDHTDFAAGYREGYRLVKGRNAFIPHLPSQPPIPPRSTAFREGLLMGISKAGKKLVDCRAIKKHRGIQPMR